MSLESSLAATTSPFRGETLSRRERGVRSSVRPSRRRYSINRAIGLALVAVGLGVSAVRRAERRFPPLGEFVAVDGVRLHYACRGGGRDVLLVHGNPGSLLDFEPTIDELAREFRVWAFDRPGHGYSGRRRGEPPTAEAQATLLRDAARELGIDRPIVVGASWGGTVALAYALAYPDETAGIVLLGALTQPFTRSYYRFRNFVVTAPVLGGLARWTIGIPWTRRWVRGLLMDAYSPDPVDADHVEAAAALWSRPGATRAAAEDTRSVKRSLRQLAPRYSEIRAPIVIVSGDADVFTATAEQAEPLHAAVPHSTLVVLAATGHLIPLTRPGSVADAVRTVLAATPS